VRSKTRQRHLIRNKSYKRLGSRPKRSNTFWKTLPLRFFSFSWGNAHHNWTSTAGMLTQLSDNLLNL